MIDLNKIVNDTMIKIEAEGYVQTVVEKKMKDTLSRVVEDCLSSYSEFGKALEKEVKGRLNINFRELKIEEYNRLVLNAINEKIEQVIHVKGAEQIKECMDKLLVDVKKEYTLSELIENFKELAIEDQGDNLDEYLTLHIEDESYGTIRVYLDEEEDQEKRNCKYCLWINKKDKMLWNVDIEGRKLSENKEMGGLFHFSDFIFKIYAAGSKIVFDQDYEDDYDLRYERNDY